MILNAFIFKTYMAMNHLDCFTMVCTSPVEKTEIANDQNIELNVA